MPYSKSSLTALLSAFTDSILAKTLSKTGKAHVMEEAAKALDFIVAAKLRDEIKALKEKV